MFYVAICDDDKAICNQIKNIINDSNSIFELYNDETILNNSSNYDIVFMDIELDQKSGIDLALKIREQNQNCIIIFVTNYTTYISDAFDVIPFQYLIKPLNEEKIKEVYNKAIVAIKNRKRFVAITWNGTIEKIEFLNIMYVERFKRSTIFHLSNGEVKKSSSKFNDYVKMLEPYYFVRCHNSTIVNVAYIKSISQSFIVLTNSEVTSISKKYLINVRNAFAKKISGEIICK